jgi:hypothetical protein
MRALLLREVGAHHLEEALPGGLIRLVADRPGACELPRSIT